MQRERLEHLVSAYLDQTILPEESEEFVRAMRDDADARKYLLLASHTDVALYDLGQARASRRVPIVSKRRPWGRIAVAAALLLGLGVFGARYWSRGEMREPIGRIEFGPSLFVGDALQTPATGALTVIGTDGTRVRAAGETSLRFVSSREILLEKGTLTAEVTPQLQGRTRLFRTSEAEALVLGTVLKLSATPGSTRLEVTQGKVSLKRLSDRRSVDVVGGHYAVAAAGSELVARPIVASLPPGFIAAPDGSPQGDGSSERPWDLSTALAHPAAVKAGDTIWLREGTYRGVFKSALQGTAEAPIVVRALPRHRATIDGGIDAGGSWTTFRGFEITNSSPQRGPERPPGLGLFGRGHKAINLVIHDTGNPGIGFREVVGDGGEVSGCILWGNGIYSAGQPVGSAVSAQNRDGRRRIRDTIAFRNFQAGLFVYAEKGFADGFDVDGNVVFDHPRWGILATGGENPLRRLRVTDNFTYTRRSEWSEPTNSGNMPSRSGVVT